MKREFAKTFNGIAALYDNARIGYPPQIYQIIDVYSKINQSSRILEIGCGTGIATEQIYNKWNSNIIAIDPGLELIEIAQKKGLDNSKIEYINCKYEDFNSHEKFDAIFSATAFHWLDKKTKYKKSKELLNENGKLILFWNNYLIENEDVHRDIQNIYRQYHPDGSIKDARLHYKNKIRNRKNEINNSQIFDLIVHHECTDSMNMNSIQYINLLKSFSNNAYLEIDKMKRFYDEVENYVNSIGNELKISIVVNLEISKIKIMN
jgi:trans-aconitate methyltransferase